MHSIASSDTYAPSAPQLPVSSEARPSIRRSRPGSRVRGRRVRDEGADELVESSTAGYRLAVDPV
ncbi:hypothetical protein ACWESM_36045, partial [Nocardia sp. NPDC003999]